MERDGVGNVKVVKIFNSRKQQALLERDGLGNAKKEITIKQGTEDARLEGLQQDNAENKRDHGMKLGFWKLRETENHRGHDRPICEKRRGSGLRPETAYKIFCFAEDDWVSLALIFWVTEN